MERVRTASTSCERRGCSPGRPAGRSIAPSPPAARNQCHRWNETFLYRSPSSLVLLLPTNPAVFSRARASTNADCKERTVDLKVHYLTWECGFKMIRCGMLTAQGSERVQVACRDAESLLRVLAPAADLQPRGNDVSRVRSRHTATRSVTCVFAARAHEHAHLQLSALKLAQQGQCRLQGATLSAANDLPPRDRAPRTGKQSSIPE